jgi:aldehyde:ferredoxin oxidoreductase
MCGITGINNYRSGAPAELGLTNPQPSDVLNEEKVRFAITTHYWNSCVDSLNICQFVFGPAWQLFSPNQLVEVVRAVTGWDVTIEELSRLGERRLTMMRVFNAREGFDCQDDTLPPKLHQALAGGKSDGARVTKEEIEWAKDWYYRLAGWDANTGNPTRAKLEALGLEWIAGEI